MTIIAERGLFVRLLVQSGKFESAAAEALVDALDAATREPATKADLQELRAELKADTQELRAELKADMQELRAELKADIQAVRSEMATLRAELKLEIHDLRKDMNALSDKLIIRLGGLMFVMLGLFFAALRLT